MIIHRARPNPPLRQPLIMGPQDPNIHYTKHRACNRQAQPRTERSWIVRRFFLDENIAGHEIRAVADTEDNRRSNSQTRATA